jgi:branched-chain amino acid transport system ATP-binding protein
VSGVGVARTFQNIRLFRGLTAAENVEATAYAHDQARDGRILELLAEAGVYGHAGRIASTLSYGDQRRLELARALAAQPAFLMRDEPAAGMNAAESTELAATIRAVRDRHGCGLIVIDHDLPFVFGLCERVHVLGEGEMIAVGSPDQIREDPRVIESYLGTDLVDLARRSP